MTKWEAAAALAAQQHGVVARRQLLGLGLSDSTLGRLLRDRGWTRTHPGVYRLPATPLTFAQRVMAAQLALPVPSIATAATAAHLYGLLPRPPRVELLVEEHDRLVPPQDVHLTRTRTIQPWDVTEVAGIRQATACRMVVDYARTALPPDVRALIIDARQRRLLELPRLEDRAKALGPVRGRGVLLRLTWELDPVRCDSVLEELIRQVIADERLPEPSPEPVKVQTPSRPVHVDIGWPDRQVGIEVDGFAYHSSRRDLERDQRRSNALALAGWTILHVGWGRIERDRDGFVAEVRALLAKDW